MTAYDIIAVFVCNDCYILLSAPRMFIVLTMQLLQQKGKVFELNCMLTFDYVLKCEVDTFSEDKQLFMITQFVM